MKFQHKYSQRVYEVLDFDVITITLKHEDDQRTITTEHLEEYFEMVPDKIINNVDVSIEEEIKSEVNNEEIKLEVSKSEVSKEEVQIKEEKEMKEKVLDKNANITLKEMCDELGITTRKGRNILRKEEIPKPGKQWVWRDYDVAQVTKKILEQNI